ncbi:MAG TPA: S53 family peptidase [Gaiellaceae bacterium]|nr:S53 family peptidase [Gaiellaceae bacterium]
MRNRTYRAVTLAALAAGIAAVTGASAAHRTPAASARPLVAQPAHSRALVSPLPTSQCLSLVGIRCYSPAQMEVAYDLASLHAVGLTGAGQTIAIVDSFGSPTIRRDLHGFDQVFGVTNPNGVPIDPAIAKDPKLTIIRPAGKVPKFRASNSEMVGWAGETTLDVEWAHVFAPGANILLVETPVSETEGVHGFPQMVKAESYVIKHHLASVISQSFGATENTFKTKKSLLTLRSAFKLAAKSGVTVLAASGDSGTAGYKLNGRDLYPFRVNSWPSSDPLVTSVGGTQLELDDAGNRLSPDVVWNDGSGAGGGGLSRIFARPAYQSAVSGIVGSHRGTPDISLSAAVDGGVWVYGSYVGQASAYDVYGGTSAATPELAGIVAIANQSAGKPLGQLNPLLYSLTGDDGIVDVTSGNNDIGPFRNSNGRRYHVPGFTALAGYDLASGLGTVDAAKLVPALVAAAAAR